MAFLVALLQCHAFAQQPVRRCLGSVLLPRQIAFAILRDAYGLAEAAFVANGLHVVC
tara:strand:- start:47 stop:217 length:171 start_codon:yes stop_codon:yes gene_type:complete